MRFCHVGPNPIRPPADARTSCMGILSSNVGAQYFWIDRIFSWEADPSNFVYQLFHTSRPGNLGHLPGFQRQHQQSAHMNAFYSLGARSGARQTVGKRDLAGGQLNNKQLNDYSRPHRPWRHSSRHLNGVYTTSLKDGSDSVGRWSALNRVYLNIGLFSEEWLLHFNPLLGGNR